MIEGWWWETVRGGGERGQRKRGLGLSVGGSSRGSMGGSGERDRVWW